MITQPHRDKLRKSNGLNPILSVFSVKKILHENWCNQFIKLMQNRMIFGFFRYGSMKSKTGKYDNIGSIKKRIAKYELTGNDEILVDCANLCMCEFVNGVHPDKHFKSVDDGEHTEVLK